MRALKFFLWSLPKCTRNLTLLKWQHKSNTYLNATDMQAGRIKKTLHKHKNELTYSNVRDQRRFTKKVKICSREPEYYKLLAKEWSEIQTKIGRSIQASYSSGRFSPSTSTPSAPSATTPLTLIKFVPLGHNSIAILLFSWQMGILFFIESKKKDQKVSHWRI